MFHHILVAIDPSPARHTALRLAGDMAQLTQAKISVLHIAASAASPSLGAVVPLEDDSEAKAVLDEAVAELRDKGVSADGTVTQALTTMIAPTISETAEEVGADLIVVSPHHRGSVEAFFHPRVSDAVAHASRVAVLLAPEEPEAQEK
ncbi:universal stress protein [Streptomyces sp. NPDC057746]|uniref:universal stress protein n=1 Tax=Streptomyces sp. NPDC057746 TaxID=3346237 RepID=UPI00368F0ECA